MQEPSEGGRVDAGGSGNGNLGGEGSGAGRLGVYDPYAGASPQLRDDDMASGGTSGLPASNIDYTNADPALDRAAFEAWLTKIRQRLPRAKGTVEISVNVSRDGKILFAEVIGGTASTQIKLFVRSQLSNETIFTGGGSEKRLPEIRLGRET